MKLDWSFRDGECTHSGYEWVSGVTGEVVSASCNSARCAMCSRRVAARKFGLARQVMETVRFPKFMTFTQHDVAGESDWDSYRIELQMVREWIRKRVHEFESLYVLEDAGSGSGVHSHWVAHGSKLPLAELQTWFGRRVDVQAARRDATGYLSKNVAMYLAKDVDGNREQIEAHMRLNGGRAEHHTRGFFLGHSLADFAKVSRVSVVPELHFTPPPF